MALLEALLAFSIVMVVLSTMAMAIVEVFHRLYKTRENYFEHIMGYMYDTHIEPAIRPLISDQSIPTASRKEFIDTMVSVTGLVKLDVEKKAESDNKLAYRFKRTERLNNVEFVQRLANTSVGQRIMDVSDEFASSFILNLTRQFDSISDGASSDFRTRSKKYSIYSGLILAFLINVDAINVFDTLTKQKAVRNNVIAMAPEAEQAFADGQQQLQALQESLDADKSEQTDQQKLASELADSISQAQASIQDSAASLANAGIPLGWDRFPYCNVYLLFKTNPDKNYVDERCQMQQASVELTLNLVAWLAGVVLAGLLIGQGSPFWFQIFQRMSVITRLIRNVSQMGRKQEAQLTPVDKPEAAPTPERAVLVFMDAMKVYKQIEELKQKPADHSS